MFFYIVVVLVQLPWLLLCAGAARRMLRARYLYSRLQFYGAALIVLCSIARLVLFDPNFGIDPLAERPWIFGYTQVEPGAVAIGLLFFGVGFFLDHRPGKEFQPWPPLAKRVSLWSLAAGTALMLVALWRGTGVWFQLPWTVPRLALTLGCYPFAVTYLSWSGRAPVRREVRMPVNL
ncbi:MAG: hypothetical protein KA184_15035 [Candidatus Hydrogenedentes bacterium]|nr:hypothetical protein [Candidatus Hydrogenedentota bacterium]